MTQEQTSWKKYLQEMDVNVTVTSDDEKSDKGNPFEKKGKSEKSEKKDNPFAAKKGKSDKKDDGEDKSKKDNPFAAKKGKSDKKDNPFAKKDDGGEDKSEKKDNPFIKKESFLTWSEWVEAKNS